MGALGKARELRALSGATLSQRFRLVLFGTSRELSRKNRDATSTKIRGSESDPWAWGIVQRSGRRRPKAAWPAAPGGPTVIAQRGPTSFDRKPDHAGYERAGPGLRNVGCSGWGATTGVTSYEHETSRLHCRPGPRSAHCTCWASGARPPPGRSWLSQAQPGRRPGRR